MTARCSECGRYRESDDARLKRIETHLRLAKEILREQSRMARFIAWIKREVLA